MKTYLEDIKTLHMKCECGEQGIVEEVFDIKVYISKISLTCKKCREKYTISKMKNVI